MDDDVLVIEGVAHQYNFSPDNFVDPHVGPLIGETLYALHRRTGGPAYTLDRETYMNGAGPERIGRALLAESQTDIICYHETPIYGQFFDGGSALWVGEEMRRLWPNRVLTYGAVSPLRPGAVDRVDELVDEHEVTALKLYPIDLVEGRVTGLDMGDPEVCFPVFQRAVERGLTVVAIHKALPVGPGPVEALRSADVEAAAVAFPQLTFEVVHGGMAFVEETAVQIEAFPNIMINLEATTNMLRYAPRRFAEAIGAFLERGGADRLIWATGCNAVHPRPVIEAFWDFEMPRDLVEGHGYPELTREIKIDVLGRNFLRMHGMDEDVVRARIAGDEFDTGDLAEPWGGLLDAAAAP
ncbi:amidohydrolase family protein [Modestobacter sp. I12A-02628]|uniref:Amidohydrolase family protein n=1 Tax=Goekera deserti TaxID=2497753 RepID=A0A7K3WB75_9ACTN|nr:amidohydrolase family protein [Goekera deserti]NDI47964.1 amidohydrolase family protein [Goekera deserti]NEL53712.1 amidohydrolase family protein [Goekera deserti]